MTKVIRTMRNAFYNRNEKRIRSGWRILLFLILFWCLAALALVIKPLFGTMTKREFMENYSLVIISILSIAATIAVWLSRKYLDKKSVSSLGLQLSKSTWKDLVFGFCLSAAMAGLFLVAAWSFDLVEITGVNWDIAAAKRTGVSGYQSLMQSFTLVTLAILLLEHILVGFWEELVFRGYLFQNMTDGMGQLPAILLSCGIYGAVHFMNPNASLLTSSVIVLFGFLRIYGYLTTGMLWLSMGMHIGWNFFQGPVFGFAASGHQKASWLELKVHDPNWLSGGSFGPEGSLLIIPIVVLALWTMRAWSLQRRFPNAKEASII